MICVDCAEGLRDLLPNSTSWNCTIRCVRFSGTLRAPVDRRAVDGSTSHRTRSPHRSSFCTGVDKCNYQTGWESAGKPNQAFGGGHARAAIAPAHWADSLWVSAHPTGGRSSLYLRLLLPLLSVELYCDLTVIVLQVVFSSPLNSAYIDHLYLM